MSIITAVRIITTGRIEWPTLKSSILAITHRMIAILGK